MTSEAGLRNRRAGRPLRALAAGLACVGALAPGLGLAANSAAPACTGKDEQQIGGFYAAAVMARDADWQQKWAKARHDALPDFTAAGEMAPGDKAHLLVFFANPLTDAGGAHVDCVLKVIRPGGKAAGFAPQRCFDTQLTGAAGDLQLTKLGADVAVDGKYPAGVWTVDLMLTDVVANRSVPLRFCYHVAGTAGGQG